MSTSATSNGSAHGSLALTLTELFDILGSAFASVLLRGRDIDRVDAGGVHRSVLWNHRDGHLEVHTDLERFERSEALDHFLVRHEQVVSGSVAPVDIVSARCAVFRPVDIEPSGDFLSDNSQPWL